MSKAFKILLNTILGAIALSAVSLTTLSAKESKSISTDFEEVDKVPEPEQIQWPEVEFAEAAMRGKAFRSNESFKFRAQWGIFRKAGYMTISTEESEDSEDNSLLVKTQTESKGFIRALYPLKLEAVTTLDKENWRVTSNETSGKTRSDETQSVTRLDYENEEMTHSDPDNPHRNGTKAIPYPVVLDYSASLLQIRSWNLEEGAKFPLMVTSKGKLYFTELSVVRKERINSLLGKTEAFVIQPVTSIPESKLFRDGGGITIWVSADDRRIPLKMEVETKYGTASMKLENFQLNDQAMQATKDKAAATQPAS